MWTQTVRDDLLEEITDNDMFSPAEQAEIEAAIRRLPLDSLIVMTAEESERLNIEDVPITERSDVALAFLMADLTYGPGRWNDSLAIEQSMGEWFSSENPPSAGI